MNPNRALKQLLVLLLAGFIFLAACQAQPAPVEDPAEAPPEAAEVEEEQAEPPPPAEEEAAEPQEEVSEPQDETAAAEKPSGNLLIWVQEANQDVFEQTVLEEFQAEYPDIQIEWVNYPPAEVADNLALAIQGGTGAPDLAITENASIPRLVELGGLVDLTDRIEPFKDQLNQPALQFGSKDGRHYSLPWDIGPVVTFYRRDIFEAAGLPTDPAEVSELVSTWDSFMETCQTIKDQTGLPCFALNKANNYGDYYINMLWQQGLGFTDAEGRVAVDSPQHVATLEKLSQFWEADLVSDQLEWTDGWYAELNAPMDDPNVDPVATIVIAAWMGNFLKTWVAADQAGNWGVAMMPAWEEGGTRSANQGGSAFIIPEMSSNKEAAWAFAEFMVARPENHLEIFQYSDYFPAWTSLYDAPLFDEPDTYFGDQTMRQVYAEAAQQMPQASIYGPFGNAMRGAVVTAVQQVALGQMAPQDALTQAAEAIRLETGLE